MKVDVADVQKDCTLTETAANVSHIEDLPAQASARLEARSPS